MTLFGKKYLRLLQIEYNAYGCLTPPQHALRALVKMMKETFYLSRLPFRFAIYFASNEFHHGVTS